MKRVIVFLLLFLMCSPAFAEGRWIQHQVFKNSRVGNIGDTSETISSAILIGSGKRFGFWATISSSIGVPSLQLHYEQATDVNDKTWATPVAGKISATLISEKPYVWEVTPVCVKYIRFKALSNGTAHNAADSEITAYLFVQTN